MINQFFRLLAWCWALGLLLAFCTSCASPEKAVYAHGSLLAPTTEAMAIWNAKLDKQCPGVRLYSVGEYDSADVTVEWSQLPEPKAIGKETGGRIEVDPDAEGHYDLATVIAHELGHALGAEHSHDKADLMSWVTPPDRGPEPTVADVHAVCSAWDGVP